MVLAAGRAVYAAGSDREAARLAGLEPTRLVFWVFAVAGMLVGMLYCDSSPVSAEPLNCAPTWPLLVRVILLPSLPVVVCRAGRTY